jgi:hypothetical protein
MTALLNPTYTVDPWDPGYGVADELDARESTARVDLDFELPAARWAPVTVDPAVPVPRTMLFLDGVRRIDARVWVHNGQPQPVPGVVASLAAGLVRCDGAARIVDVRVDRGLYTAAREATDLKTRHATYTYRHAPGGLDKLTLAVQQRLTELEVELAASWRAANTGDDDLLIVDGPLRGRTHLARTAGYIKTHNKSYLPPAQTDVVAALGPGQRTPVFTMGTSWDRHSWYLRLPGAASTPWSALVRLECPATLSREDAARLADITARTLPTLASTPHKDPRAPQNLVPIGGLERQLRHRLGDQALLYRSLRTALR